MINIQSISDLITNSSTEVFVVYDKDNINSIKELVNAILSLNGNDKTFDDYFEIEMLINYDLVTDALDYFIDEVIRYDNLPEIEIYNTLTPNEQEEYVKNLPIDRIEEIIQAYGSYTWSRCSAYFGFSVTAKTDDPIVEKVANVINCIDNIFEIDYSDNY